VNIEYFIILGAVGIIAGILSGMFGIGGGVIIVPSLITLYTYYGFNSHYLVHVAIATSLLIVAVTSIITSFRHYKLNNVIWSAAIITGITGALCVFWFSFVVLNLNGKILSIIISVVMIIIALKLVIGKKSETGNKNECIIEYDKWLFIPTGLLIGIISAFTGLGGGIFIIPILHYFFKIPFKKAIGTSSVAIIFTAIGGVVSYYFNKPDDFAGGIYFFGLSDLKLAVPILLFSIPASYIGVHLNTRMNNSLLSKLFGFLILVIAAKIILL
jgi:uncharacterized membrane protein YfcA